MRSSWFTQAACGMVVLLAVAGCSSGEVSGSPTSVPSFSVPSTTTSAFSVVNPLTVEKLQKDMCSGLTAAQLAPYTGTIRKQEPKEDVARTPLCGWLPTDGNLPGIALYADSKARGVTDLYEKKLGDNFFEKIPLLAGYPAIRRSASPDGPQIGDCMTIVAVSDQATITIYAMTVGKNYQYYKSMCTVSDKLAEAAVENLKARG